ncbi:MAG: SHOCT domain-containing protein [Cyanobacteria bacterium P01_F01_bin.53]
MSISGHNRRVAIALALTAALPPLTPLLAWSHKFYLGQYLWGVVYLVLAATSLSKVVWIACALEGFWYITQSDDSFMRRFPAAGSALSAVTELAKVEDNEDERTSPQLLGQQLNHQLRQLADKLTKSPDEKKAEAAQAATQVATALRDLDQLRQDGLMTEYEFEQKRRKLLEQIS